MRTLARAALLLALLAGCGSETPQASDAPPPIAPAGETVALTPRYRAGEVVVYEHSEVSHQAQATSIHGLTRVINERRRFRLETTSVDDAGGAVLRLTMEHVASKVEDNGQTVFDFDSDVPGDDGSGQARARRLLSRLVADIRVAPGGTVVTMAANLTPADLESVPRAARIHLAENWFRVAIESLYRPFGERSSVVLAQPWEESVHPGRLFPGDEHQLVTTSRAEAVPDDQIEILAESLLYTAGEAKPDAYQRRSRYRWSVEQGRLLSYHEVQRAVVEGMLAGVASAEVAEREISFRAVNPSPPNVENPPVDPPGR